MDTTGGTGLIIYSSKTGNTRTLARGVVQGLGMRVKLAAIEENLDALSFSWVIIGFGLIGEILMPRHVHM